MVLNNLAYIIIVVGFGLLVLNRMGRRRVRQSRKEVSGMAAWWLRWGDFIALGMILAGMLRMGK